MATQQVSSPSSLACVSMSPTEPLLLPRLLSLFTFLCHTGVESPTHEIRADAAPSARSAKSIIITLANRHTFDRPVEILIHPSGTGHQAGPLGGLWEGRGADPLGCRHVAPRPVASQGEGRGQRAETGDQLGGSWEHDSSWQT